MQHGRAGDGKGDPLKSQRQESVHVSFSLRRLPAAGPRRGWE
jgi:hypothetical protein